MAVSTVSPWAPVPPTDVLDGTRPGTCRRGYKVAVPMVLLHSPLVGPATMAPLAAELRTRGWVVDVPTCAGHWPDAEERAALSADMPRVRRTFFDGTIPIPIDGGRYRPPTSS